MSRSNPVRSEDAQKPIHTTNHCKDKIARERLGAVCHTHPLIWSLLPIILPFGFLLPWLIKALKLGQDVLPVLLSIAKSAIANGAFHSTTSQSADYEERHWRATVEVVVDINEAAEREHGVLQNNRRFMPTTGCSLA